jgi:hypothetical protein
MIAHTEKTDSPPTSHQSNIDGPRRLEHQSAIDIESNFEAEEEGSITNMPQTVGSAFVPKK